MSATWKITKYFCGLSIKFALVLYVLCSTGAATEYKYSFLKDRPLWPVARGINDNEDVIFYETIDGGPSYFSYIYREGNYIKLLPQVTPEFIMIYAFAINNRGDVLVRCIRDTYMSHNKWFLYSDGSYIDLTPPFGYFGGISDINDSGVMVGYIVDSSWSENQTKGFQYDGGTYKELLPPGWSNSEAIRINNNGTVIGYGSKNNIDTGFLYNNGEYSELLPPGWQFAFPEAINNQDVVVLKGCDSGGHTRMAVYNQGVYTELPPPPGPGSPEIIDINDKGEFIVNNDCYAYIYHDGHYTELLPPGWDWCRVKGINNNGDIVGDRHMVFIAGPEKIDSDGDDVADESDSCGNSILDSTISIGWCNTGVPNKLLGEPYDIGCTMQDRIRECARNSNRSTFFQCVTDLTKAWREYFAYPIRWNEKVRIQICAAIGKIPK